MQRVPEREAERCRCTMICEGNQNLDGPDCVLTWAGLLVGVIITEQKLVLLNQLFLPVFIPNVNTSK